MLFEFRQILRKKSNEKLNPKGTSNCAALLHIAEPIITLYTCCFCNVVTVSCPALKPNVAAAAEILINPCIMHRERLFFVHPYLCQFEYSVCDATTYLFLKKLFNKEFYNLTNGQLLLFADEAKRSKMKPI